MEKEKAKAFLFDATHGNNDCVYLFQSKNLNKLLEMNDGELVFIYAIVDTANGTILMNMDWSYEEEPIIMDRFLHLKSFLKYNPNKIVVDLDKKSCENPAKIVGDFQ